MLSPAARPSPTSFDQWWTIRRYGKTAGRLTVREPRLESGRPVDLAPFLADYAGLIALAREAAADAPQCGRDADACCRRPLWLSLIEAVALARTIDVDLSSELRQAVIERSAGAAREMDDLTRLYGDSHALCVTAWSRLCPLAQDGACLVFDNRPAACLLYGVPGEAAAALWEKTLEPALSELSRQIFLALAGTMGDAQLPHFALPDVASGRYVSAVFQYLLAQTRR